MKHFFLQLVFIIVAFTGSFNGLAQINSPSVILSTPTSANSNNYFYSSIADGKLIGENNLAGGTKCIWHQFDTISNQFSILLQEELSTTSILTNIINNGGYQLTCTNGTDSTFYYCWTFEPSINVDPIAIDTLKTDCTSLFLEAKTKTKDLYYRDPNMLSKPIKVNYNLLYTWIDKPIGEPITPVWNPRINQSVDTTIYSLTVTNSVGLAPFYDTLAPAYIGRGLQPALKIVPIVDSIPNNLDEVNSSPQLGSAPYTVSFKDLSKGTYDFAQVVIYKDDKEIKRIDYDINRTYTFNSPGEYNVKMAISKYEPACDQISGDNLVTIAESMLGIPNTFTPNGDGQNDEFRVSYISLKSYSIYIYNRWGRMVYQSDNPGDGWDGSGLETGVYLYIIEYTSTDGASHTERGTIHLLTDK